MRLNHNLSSLERHEQIIKFVQQHQRMTVDQICEQFAISPATARRDLEALAEQGTIQRFHGGARAIHQAPPELPALQRETEQIEEKRRIGQSAAKLINDGETVFLGSGTTVLEVARHLRDRRNLTVITNSLLVINALANIPDMTLVGLGGILRLSEMSMIGHLTEQALAEVNTHKIIMGIRAVDIKHGLTNDYLPETMTDRAILAHSGEVIVVADHTKCERVSVAFVAPVTAMQKFITDSNTSPAFIEALRAKGVEVIVV
jgi:DeoR/GlpR family transcriptional regulator of sugar metabolism